MLAGFSDGDARGALNALETAYQSQRSNECKPVVIGLESVKEVMQRTHIQYDRMGESWIRTCITSSNLGSHILYSRTSHIRTDWERGSVRTIESS